MGAIYRLPEAHRAPCMDREGLMQKFLLCLDLATAQCLLEEPFVVGHPRLVSSRLCQKWAEPLMGSFLRRAYSELTDLDSGVMTESFKHLGSICFFCVFLNKQFTVNRWEFFTSCFYFLFAEKTTGWSWLMAPPWRMCFIHLLFSS